MSARGDFWAAVTLRVAAASAFFTCSRKSNSSRYSFSSGLNNSVSLFGLVRRIAELEFEYLIMKSKPL
jgi:hypothetical protein